MRWSRGNERQASAPSAAPSADTLPPPLIAANGDVLIDELLGLLQSADQPLMGFLLADHASGAGYLRDDRVLFAGTHEGVALAAAAPTKYVRLHLATREVGLATRAPEPLGPLSTLCQKRLALRPRTAGVRAKLDQALMREGIPHEEAYRHAQEHASHRDAVLAVAAGRADVALTTHAWAKLAQLAFFALDSEAYALLVRAERLGDPRVVRACEVAQSGLFRRTLQERHGYGVARTGELRFL